MGDGFREIFNLAFPSRPLEKLDILIKELVDEDDTIAIGQLLVLLYMFSDGKTTDNLTQMFKLFDADNSGFICLNELRELMASSSRSEKEKITRTTPRPSWPRCSTAEMPTATRKIGEGKNHENDPATVMAEMFHRGDADGNE